TVVVTRSSSGAVDVVRRSASFILSSGRSYESGIARGAGPASAGGLVLGAFCRRERRKISPFSLGSEPALPSFSGPFIGGPFNLVLWFCPFCYFVRFLRGVCIIILLRPVGCFCISDRYVLGPLIFVRAAAGVSCVRLPYLLVPPPY